MKSLSAALFVGLGLGGGRAEAQIAVNGYADAGGPVGVGLQLVGSSRGFTYEQGFSVRHNIPGADTCNGEPLNCAPGTTVSLAVRGTDQSGTATLDGQTYAVSPNGINTIYLQFDASIVLPALAPTAQVTSSFTFTGSFTYRPQDSS